MNERGARGAPLGAAALLAVSTPAAAGHHAAVWHGILEPPAEGSCRLVLAPTEGAFAARSDMWAGDLGIDDAGDGRWIGTTLADGEVVLDMGSGRPERIRVRESAGSTARTCTITRFGRPLGRDSAAPRDPRQAGAADGGAEFPPPPDSPLPPPAEAEPPGRAAETTAAASPLERAAEPAEAVAETPEPGLPLPVPDPGSALSGQILEAARTAADPEVRTRLIERHERYLGRR